MGGATGGAEGAGSINPFVKGLSSGKAITTQAHPKNEDIIVSAQQCVKPMRAMSTRRKGTIKRMETLRMAKAFESHFGSVTCLPGSFTSFRC